MKGFSILLLVCLGPLLASADDDEKFQKVLEEAQNLQKYVHELTRQVMMQQYRMDERIRSEGQSGIKIRRGTSKGLKNYYSATHSSGSSFANHDHSNYDRTIGLGELVVVMNGVEFRTRHNDYKLYMPSTTSKEYQETENLPFPEVPPEVTAKENIEDQVDEMVEFFRAFKDQNSTHRDYKKYFKPNLCYMEGMWTLDETLTESFESDRHILDASSWFDLQQKVRYNAYTGLKDNLENFAYLPTAIVSINATTGEPVYAQWNYRILCYPLKQDIPFKHLHQVDDVGPRATRHKSIDEVFHSRIGRFKLHDYNRKRDGPQLLDELFTQIPGLDNIPDAQSHQTLNDEVLYDALKDGQVPLNSGYYNRWYKSASTQSKGKPNGFNDNYLFIATNTQPRIAPICYKPCSDGQCTEKCNRVSYALPMEIVYTTPLLTWNPYNLPFWDDKASKNSGRNGDHSLSKAYNGTDKSTLYQTPTGFFTGETDTSDAADTVKNSAWVLDLNNEMHSMAAAGTRIITPAIKSIGSVRLRWPIAPIHYEAGPVMQEVNALKSKIVGNLIEGPPAIIFLDTGISTKTPPGEHVHEIDITYEQYLKVREKELITVTTSLAQGHTHTMTLKYSGTKNRIKFDDCDGEFNCFDKHDKWFTLKTVSPFVTLAY